jgi:hypothetical protein
MMSYVEFRIKFRWHFFFGFCLNSNRETKMTENNGAGEQPGPWAPSKQQLEISSERRRQIFGANYKEVCETPKLTLKHIASPHRCNPHVTDFITALYTLNNVGIAARMTWSCFTGTEGEEEKSWLMLDHRTGDITNKEFVHNKEG